MTVSGIKTLFCLLFILFIQAAGFTKIKESELVKHNELLLHKLLSDNKDYKPVIQKYLNGVVKGNNSGMRLIDKLGLFVYDSKKNGATIDKTRFYQGKDGKFLLILVFKDKSDSEYVLHLEYQYENWKKECTLIDVYFSLVFGEKKEQIEKYFRYR